jgi:membrane protein DedA with SNARE-associated domain
MRATVHPARSLFHPQLFEGNRVALEAFTTAVIEFVKTHEAWAAPVVFGLAFGESLAFLSLLLPATVILFGIGGMIGASGIQLLPVWIGAVSGSILGYALSYWIGLYFKDEIVNVWPFSKYPDMIPRGRDFFQKYGALGVFAGHFFGPLRAVVPVIAGMYAMPQVPFQIANVLSSALWSTGILMPGYLGLKYWLG